MVWSIISIAAYVALLLHTYTCKQSIECLSDIAYDRHRLVFPALMGVMAVGLFAAIGTCVAFIGSAAMIGIALTPYREEANTAGHRLCTYIAIACVFWLWSSVGYWYMPCIFMLASIRKRWLLGIEMGTLASALSYSIIAAI